MEIHALAATESGAPLQDWTYETGELDAFDCVIEVKACGLCRSDLHMIDNDWQNSRYPLVPGHEVVGEVVEIGEDVEHLSVGDRVGVGWQHSSCMQCDDCLNGDENLCDDAESLIGDHYGGFADYVKADGRFVFHLPDEIDTLHGGPLLCGGITVYSALRHAGMTSGGRVGVIGIGGLGHMAVQFASKMGNVVTAFTSSEEKADFAHELGADKVVVTDGMAAPEPGDARLDQLVSTAPASFEWNSYLQWLDTDGTLSLVADSGAPMEIPISSLMFQRRRVMGSIIGGRAMMTDMLRVAADHGIEPVIERFDMDEANDAIEKLRNRDVRYRAVLER